MEKLKALSVKFDDIHRELEQYFSECIAPEIDKIKSYSEYEDWHDNFLNDCVDKNGDKARNPFVVLIHSYLYNFDWYVNKEFGEIAVTPK